MRSHIQAAARGRATRIQNTSARVAPDVASLQRAIGNKATGLLLQRHAAQGLTNSFGSGGLSDVILTPKGGGKQIVGDISFTQGRAHELTEVQRHAAQGLTNSFGSGGLTGMIFTPRDGGPQMIGDLSFRQGRAHELKEVQRHAAPGLTNAFGSGGLSDAIFTPQGGGPQMIVDMSFRAGRAHELNEAHAPGPPTGGGLLRIGSKGPEVAHVQERLNSAGESLDVDGKFGGLTDGAVRRFQRSHGLNPDGVVGPKTKAALFGGSGGGGGREAAQAPADDAIHGFQSSHGLSPSGALDDETHDAVGRR